MATAHCIVVLIQYAFWRACQGRDRVVPFRMLRDCAALIVLALAAIGGLTWTIMALRKSLARERRLARVDDLTGVRNARAFHEAAGAEIERARRYQHPFSVAVVDLGSRVGDDLVRGAATALRGALRATVTALA